MNDGMFYVLLSLSVISIVIAIVSLLFVLSILQKQKELIRICKTKPVESHATVVQVAANRDNAVQNSNIQARKHGVVICKNCYAAIPETSTVCSFCKVPTGRR